jgi:hypothetical protein
MMTSFFNSRDFVSLYGKTDDEVDKRKGSGQSTSHENSFVVHQTIHHQGILFPGDENTSLN